MLPSATVTVQRLAGHLPFAPEISRGKLLAAFLSAQNDKKIHG